MVLKLKNTTLDSLPFPRCLRIEDSEAEQKMKRCSWKTGQGSNPERPTKRYILGRKEAAIVALSSCPELPTQYL